MIGVVVRAMVRAMLYWQIGLTRSNQLRHTTYSMLIVYIKPVISSTLRPPQHIGVGKGVTKGRTTEGRGDCQGAWPESTLRENFKLKGVIF